MTFGFVIVAAVVGSAKGASSVISTLVVLVSTVFVHELARALFARSYARSSRICMSAAGGDTAVSGPALGGLPAVLFTVAGSVANALNACSSCSTEPGDTTTHAPARPEWNARRVTRCRYAFLTNSGSSLTAV